MLDYDGRILWSFHIWMTDAPEKQIYYRYDPETQAFTDEVVCTMMDRNLGATSASVDDGVATYGLLYQFNRKDPLLGSTVIDGDDATFTVAASTAAWPRLYESHDYGSLTEYADYHPTVIPVRTQTHMTYIGKGDQKIVYPLPEDLKHPEHFLIIR